MSQPIILVDVNLGDSIQRLRSQFYGLSDAEFKRRIAALINESARGGKTEAGKSTQERFSGIKKGLIQKAGSLDKASASTLTAKIIHKGSPIPISLLSGRQTKKGVTFNLTGKRQLMNGTFLRTAKTDVRVALARGVYTGKGNSGFEFAKPRYPLGVIRSVSVPGAMMTKVVSNKIEKRIGTDFERRAVNVLTNAMQRRRTT
jgi:hypothetical protein